MNKCFNCDNKGQDVYGYTVCSSCKTKLGLLTDETIERQRRKYNDKKRSENAYNEEIKRRLDFIEKDYTKKRIKLLHILSRLEKN